MTATFSNCWWRVRKSCSRREITQASVLSPENQDGSDDAAAAAAAADDDDDDEEEDEEEEKDESCRSMTTAK